MILVRRSFRQFPKLLNTKSYTTGTKDPNNARNGPHVSKSVIFSGGGIVAGAYGAYWYQERLGKVSTSGDHQDEVPILNNSVGFPMNLSPPSDEEVTRILNEEAYSYKAKDINGVQQYHGAQIQSSSPCEDRVLHGKFPSPLQDNGEWMTWGVFDGHAGWEVAELLTKHLLPYVQHELSTIPLSPTLTIPNPLIEAAIKSAFISFDNHLIFPATEILNAPLPFPAKAALLSPPSSGSCALLSLYDPTSQTLHTACTGDSRAVLGVLKSNGNWETIPLTSDQNALNAAEVARLHAEHPNEPDMIAGDPGRLYGIMVMRAFGDAGWKWENETQVEIEEKYNGKKPKGLKSPPYLTAEPVVTSTELGSLGKGRKFLIQASDGLWDTMSSEQAVGLVGKWIEWQEAGKSNQDIRQKEGKFGEFDLKPYYQGTMWQFEEKKTAICDENAAVHLIRNAMGGRHLDMLRGSFVFKAPSARTVRDDVTVQVVFFD